MPVVLLLLVPLLLLFVVVLSIVLLPVSLVQRYRIGTARRPGRGWLAGINLVSLWLSSMLFALAAAVTSLWVPGAFAYTLAGFAAGALYVDLRSSAGRVSNGARMSISICD